MGRKKKDPDVKNTWCWYCNREFSGEKLLIKHQKTKHFKCSTCHKKLYTGPGLSIHCLQVHGDSIDKVPNALSNRNNVEIEIYGMEGISEDDLKEHEMMKQAKLIIAKKNILNDLEKQKSPSPQMPIFNPIQQVHHPPEEIPRHEHLRQIVGSGTHVMGPIISQSGQIMGQVSTIGQMNPMIGSIGTMGPVGSCAGEGSLIGSQQNNMGGSLSAHNSQTSLSSTSLNHDKLIYPLVNQPATCTLSFQSFNQPVNHNIAEVSTFKSNQAVINMSDRSDSRKYNLMGISSIFGSPKMHQPIDGHPLSEACVTQPNSAFYEEKLKQFINRKSEELAEEGVNPGLYDFDLEWAYYWNNTEFPREYYKTR